MNTKLLKTVYEVESHVRGLIEEHKAISKADVQFRLTGSGEHGYNRRYHVWIDGDNKRADCVGVADDGRTDSTQILTPTYSFHDDRVIDESQYAARRPNEGNVGWSGTSSVPDIRKFGVVNWFVESVASHDFQQHLLPENRKDVRVVTDTLIEGAPVTTVRMNKTHKNAADSWCEYALSPAQGNRPIYITAGSTLPDQTKLKTVQQISWKQFDGIWFPARIEFTYEHVGKNSEQSAVEVLSARFGQSISPKVFAPESL